MYLLMQLKMWPVVAMAAREKEVIRKTIISRDKSARLSSLRNLMSSGRMSLDWRMLRMHWRRRLSYPSDSRKFSQAVESHGRGFCSMAHQEQARPFWRRPAQRKPRAPSSQFLLQIWWVSTWERVRSWSRPCSIAQGRRSHRSSSLTRSTLCAAIDPMVRTKHLEEWRLSFWCRCRVWATMILVCLSSVRPTYHGRWIQPSDVVSREGSTSHFQNMKRGTVFIT